MIYLELIPPAQTDKPIETTGQFFSVLHGLLENLSISLEIVSTRAEGVRYVIGVPENKVDSLILAINAYLPEVNVRQTTDYLSSHVLAQAKTASFSQTKHFAYPLRSQSSLASHDPLAYIAGTMVKLKKKDLMSLQIVMRPVRPKEVEAIDRKILANEDVALNLQKKRSKVLSLTLKTIDKLLFALTDLVTELWHGSSSSGSSASAYEAHEKRQVQLRLKPARVLSTFEQDLVASIHDKLSKPLFEVDIRVLVSCHHRDEGKRRLDDITAAFSVLDTPKYQSLRPNDLKKQLNYITHRLPPNKKTASLLSASELATIYHFPNILSNRTENVNKSLSRKLPAPISLKDGTELDIILGENNYHGDTTPIGLTREERERHVYVIGGTGNGKTTMLLYGIVQDMQAGKGLAIIDPHGDMAETVLKHVPKDRLQDVIYFNPDDLLYPIGLNLLEHQEGLSGLELMREKDLITESVISVFRKIFTQEDAGGHRIEYVLRNTVQTALTIPDANLFTVFKLLNDPKYRKKVTSKLEDQDLKSFWKNELGKAGEMQKVKMSAGITSKVGRFLFSATAKHILEQPKSTIDFDDIINSSKILICNFSKGLIGEDTSELFGITVLAKLQLASLRRARMPQNKRQPFYLYVDEFQNFATASFVQMLSESRKYKVFMTMAEQSTSQQKDQQMVSIILANVGSVFCFRTANPQDERLLLPLFSPNVEQGEISNLPTYNFYAKLFAVNAQEPLSGQTLLLKDTGSAKVAEAIVELSRKNYAIAIDEETNTQLPSEPANEQHDEEYVGDGLPDEIVS